MEFNTLIRYLVQGPYISLENLHELLYFDGLTCSEKTLVIVSNSKARRMASRLRERGLIVHRNDLLSASDLEEFDTFHPAFGETKNIARTFRRQELVNRDFASLLRRKGTWAIPKFYSIEYRSLFGHADDEVLSVVFSQFPQIEIAENNIDNFVDFVTDAETIEKRRRLFSWQNAIERNVMNGRMTLTELYETMESDLEAYISWRNKHIQHFKYRVIAQGTFEILSGILISYFADQALLGIPISIAKGFLTFRKNTIELNKEELGSPGRELAYLVHMEERLYQFK